MMRYLFIFLLTICNKEPTIDRFNISDFDSCINKFYGKEITQISLCDAELNIIDSITIDSIFYIGKDSVGVGNFGVFKMDSFPNHKTLSEFRCIRATGIVIPNLYSIFLFNNVLKNCDNGAICSDVFSILLIKRLNKTHAIYSFCQKMPLSCGLRISDKGIYYLEAKDIMIDQRKWVYEINYNRINLMGDRALINENKTRVQFNFDSSYVEFEPIFK